MERIKSVMQVRESSHQKAPYSWSGACLMDLVQKEGFKNGLFRGMTSLVYREIPQFAIYYPSYHLWKQLYMQVISSTFLPTLPPSSQSTRPSSFRTIFTLHVFYLEDLLV
jgi:hypothetical protein